MGKRGEGREGKEEERREGEGKGKGSRKGERRKEGKRGGGEGEKGRKEVRVKQQEERKVLSGSSKEQHAGYFIVSQDKAHRIGLHPPASPSLSPQPKSSCCK